MSTNGVCVQKPPTDVVPPACSLSVLLPDLRRHPELDYDTLAYHLAQSDATAAAGYWHATTNEARSFLEALIVGMRHVVKPDTPGKPRGATNGAPFRCYRRTLLDAGFIDADENELLQYIYSVASAKGSHPGVTTEAWSRLARRMVHVAAQYFLARYEAWKSNGRRTTRPAASAPQPSNTWRRRLLTLTRRWLQ